MYGNIFSDCLFWSCYWFDFKHCVVSAYFCDAACECSCCTNYHAYWHNRCYGNTQHHKSKGQTAANHSLQLSCVQNGDGFARMRENRFLFFSIFTEEEQNVEKCIQEGICSSNVSNDGRRVHDRMRQQKRLRRKRAGYRRKRSYDRGLFNLRNFSKTGC